MCLKHSFYSPDVTFITNIFGWAALTFMSFVTLKAGEGELNISARMFSLLSSCYPSTKTLPPKTCKHTFCQTGSSLPAQQKYSWFGIHLHAKLFCPITKKKCCLSQLQVVHVLKLPTFTSTMESNIFCLCAKAQAPET